MKFHVTLIAFALLALGTGPALAQDKMQQAADAKLTQKASPRIQAVPLSREDVSRGWPASQVLNRETFSSDGRRLGEVRNVLVGKDGHIVALLVEADPSSSAEEFVFRAPWQKVYASSLPTRVVIDVPDGRQPENEIFSEMLGRDRQLDEEFAVTAVIGDYARLQTGIGYGYVRDVVFTRDGRMRAVLVTRGALAGGGTVAFGFSKSPSERWNPDASYYGLPYVTAEQANAAAVAVDPKRLGG